MTGFGGQSIPHRPILAVALLMLVLATLAMLRPVDHDESQYVAAAVLTAHELLPYRDFAYLQTPLQPFLFAPLAAVAGAFVWPALRLANALLGAVTVVAIAGAARAGSARPRMAYAAAALFAACDITLFSIATARNDVLPAALLAVALWLAMLPATRGCAAAIGLLLAGAAAAKVSYAIPALAYGAFAMRYRREPLWVAIGAAPVAVFVAWTFALSPEGFWFGTFRFPALAPGEYYRATDRAWKLGLAAKALDTAKFLALGPALLALAVVARRRIGGLPTWLIVAGLLAALLPTPTWRQYLLPLLPPLFVALAILWTRDPPNKAMRIAAAAFAAIGLAPSLAAVAGGGGMADALPQGEAIRTVLDRARQRGPIATLSPEFLPSTGRLPDPRFATGPFYFRSARLLSPVEERRLALVSRDTLALAPLPQAVLTGGEGPWTAGDATLDQQMAVWARRAGYRRTPVPGSRFTLWLAPPPPR